MSFLFGRDGKISLFRLGVFLAVLGAVVIVGGIVIFSLERTTYQGPLNIDPYPGAEDWGREDVSSTLRRLKFKIPGVKPEDVAAYYQQKVTEFYGGDNQNPNAKCTRYPPSGNLENYKPGSNDVPYFWKCFFERPGFGLLQTTEVIIQPGVPNTDPAQNTEGMTVVQHEQQWEP